jgi:hypothetical protein
MNVYTGYYNYTKYGSRGGYDSWEIATVVVANTTQEALGLLLNQYPDTYVENWEIDTVDINKVEIKELINNYEER